MTELTLTPDAHRRVVRTNVVGAVPYALLLAVPASSTAMLTGRGWLAAAAVALAVALVAATAVSAARMARRSRLVFGDGTYAVVGGGRARRFTAAQVTTAAMVTHMSLGAGATHHLIVAGAAKPLVHLVGQVWDRQQLTALAHDLAARGVPVASVIEPITPRALRSRDPRLMAAWRARPLLTALVAAAVGVAVAVVVITVAASLALVATEN
ncbi:hypothetical protein [Cellulomonas shaoxiangyii]|uniref:PH domain-containing protein n=1 Tax=Cellulomonas shaoxiangyii TaxID=2566013 RepID=A0A4P7SIV9_9CELL|nr:hypothetical protein [Cellulomonas shaoxiangyii]QCB93598.1 hypothetical protein E5225_08520 [Cellulomonas shaoxiangyii]TGY85697.1 hypothetical protein E5226_05315 [Cellulomonas shaoxiangyii]